MSEMDDVVRDFLIESRENLDRLDSELVRLESEPGDRETLASVFRTIHTIKGTCGFLGFAKLGRVAHAGENLLAKLRDGVLELDDPITDALLATIDAVRQILARVEQSGSEGDDEYGALVERLAQLTEPRAAPAASEPEPVARLGTVLVGEGLAPAESVERALAAQTEGDTRRLGEILVESAEVHPSDVTEALRLQSDLRAQGDLSDASIRVDVGLLDRLMDLVGELVLARNQILQFQARQDDAQFGATTQRLNLVTTELQESVMKTRMQPIGNVWSKFPRVVRDLAKSCGKQVRLEFEGKETELDKTIIEAIKDPLTHIVRNSVDHGIESPEVRLAAGKPAEGVLHMRAFHEGGQVNIEIRDDGGGIAVERVRAKALESGAITAEQAARMGERELFDLIFLPGLSTAARVTGVSGRGVGMDVVRTNIERIGGTIDVHSERGRGTTLRIKIPLTLAIIPALIVTSAGERYAIPQVSLLELVRLEADKAALEIDELLQAPVYRLRGRLLPLVHLHQLLGSSSRREADSAVNIVVLQADGRQFGLVVDEINDTEEIVVKPLGKQLKGLAAFAGATIMGDGRVALILDVTGVSSAAQLGSGAGAHADLHSRREDAAAAPAQATVIVFRVGADRRMAMPLADVARLEEFSRDSLERAGGRPVVQYRGEILPLYDLAAALGDGSAPADGKCLVIVYSRGGRNLGLVVDAILDIVSEDYVVQPQSRGASVLGSAVIQKRVTDLLDVEALLAAHDALIPAHTLAGASAA